MKNEIKKTKIGRPIRIFLDDEEIYELREQRLSYLEIAKHFKEQGIEVSYQIISKRCKKIYEIKGKEEPETKKEIEQKIIIPDEEIYELREKGLTYRAIAKYFKEQGIKISYEIIRKRCKKIYELKEKEEPKTKRGPKLKIKIPDEEIYELREQGLLYQEIVKYFKEQGIEISHVSVMRKCKKIYELKGKEEPKVKRGPEQKIIISDEKIYKLREQGLSYNAIVNHFKEQGKDVSYQTIRRRCKKIYKLKGEEEPEVKRGIKQKIIISDKEILELRDQGLSYMAIANYFKEQGIEISHVSVMRKCKKIYELKEKEESEVKSEPKKINDVRKSELDSLEEKLQNAIEKKKETKRLLEDYKKLEEKLQQERNGEEK